MSTSISAAPQGGATIASTLLAFVAAPATAASMLVLYQGNPAAWIFWPWLFAIAFVPTIIAGLPLFLLLRRMGYVRWWSSVCAGLLVGKLSSVALAAGMHASIDWRGDWVWAGAGALSGLAFWSIWRLGLRAKPKAPT